MAEWDPDIRTKRPFLGDPYLLHIRVPEHIGTERAISLLKTNPNVEYAEKNGLCHPFVIPIDPDFYKQWGMRNIGQTGGKPDADIDATNAWDIFTGSPDVVVAVIDSGIDYNHLDLQANIDPARPSAGAELDLRRLGMGTGRGPAYMDGHVEQ